MIKAFVRMRFYYLYQVYNKHYNIVFIITVTAQYIPKVTYHPNIFVTNQYFWQPYLTKGKFFDIILKNISLANQTRKNNVYRKNTDFFMKNCLKI